VQVADLSHIALAGLFLGGLGTSLATVLAVASRKLYVYEDPRIDVLETMLPRTNCGACGTPGCRAFAEALIDNKIVPAECTVCTSEEREAIAGYLGVAVGQAEKRVARLACAGGRNVAWNRAHYDGLSTCRAAALVGGGGKGCVWGCLGLGDCEEVCDYDAIQMDAHGLPVVTEEKCTACNDCVEVCPRQLFSIHPVSHHLWVACANQDATDAARAVCEVVCDGCGRCAADAAPGLIEIKNNLAVVDYANNAVASRTTIERCPTGAIVWWDEKLGATKGLAARKVLHKEALPIRERA
jgi:Na+-translocating ferredoxin:NAD+ oxidoreductase RNF subunit RnfB